MSDKMLNFSKIAYQLKNVEYNLFTRKIESDLKINDGLSFKSFIENQLILKFTRTVVFNEADKSILKVEYELIMTMKDDAIIHFKGDQNTAEKFIHKNEIDIVNKSLVGTNASLLISNVTQLSGIPALILPPYFIEENQQ